MKSFTVFCVVLVAGIHAATVTLPPTQEEKAHQLISECIKETGVKTEVLQEAMKSSIIEDEGLKKFLFCFFKKAEIVDSEGKLNIETAIAKLPPGVDKEDDRKVLEDCKSKTGKNLEDTVFEIFMCYYKGTKTHISCPYLCKKATNHPPSKHALPRYQSIYKNMCRFAINN